MMMMMKKKTPIFYTDSTSFFLFILPKLLVGCLMICPEWLYLLFFSTSLLAVDTPKNPTGCFNRRRLFSIPRFISMIASFTFCCWFRCGTIDNLLFSSDFISRPLLFCRIPTFSWAEISTCLTVSLSLSLNPFRQISCGRLPVF